LVSRYLGVIEIPVINYFPSLEVTCIDIYDGASRFRLFNVYRRPYDDALCIDYMNQLVSCFDKTSSHILKTCV